MKNSSGMKLWTAMLCAILQVVFLWMTGGGAYMVLFS